jgi:exonuclease III
MVNDNQMTGINSITTFHQNICGLREKTDELTSSLFPYFPCILRFSEHHLKQFELDQINVDGNGLGAAYCRQVANRGGVCIFAHKNLNYITIDLGKYCKDQDTEVCALKLEYTSFNACIMAVYRAPTGNFNLFLNGLDGIIRTLYKADLKLIICGDININYLTDSDKKKNLMQRYLVEG